MSGLIGGSGVKSGVINEVGLGVPCASFFKLTSNHTGDETQITAWSNANTGDDETGNVGGGNVTVSSGNFTLPSRGVWLIQGSFYMYHHTSEDDEWTGVRLRKGSTSINHCTSGQSPFPGTANIGSCPMHHILDHDTLSDTYNFISYSMGDQSYIQGEGYWTSSFNIASCVSFIKLSNNTSTGPNF